MAAANNNHSTQNMGRSTRRTSTAQRRMGPAPEGEDGWCRARTRIPCSRAQEGEGEGHWSNNSLIGGQYGNLASAAASHGGRALSGFCRWDGRKDVEVQASLWSWLTRPSQPGP